jgi:hypothetical protein
MMDGTDKNSCSQLLFLERRRRQILFPHSSSFFSLAFSLACLYWIPVTGVTETETEINFSPHLFLPPLFFLKSVHACCHSFIVSCVKSIFHAFLPAAFRSALIFRFTLVNFTFFCLTLFSKFCFNFPSQYLFAIGLTVVFSVRTHLRPTSNFHTPVPRCATLK